MLLRTLIPILEHKTVLSFKVTRNKNQTGNRFHFLSLYSIIYAVLPFFNMYIILVIEVCKLYNNNNNNYKTKALLSPMIRTLLHAMKF